jgi:hypothetical protein
MRLTKSRENLGQLLVSVLAGQRLGGLAFVVLVHVVPAVPQKPLCRLGLACSLLKMSREWVVEMSMK